MGLSLPVKQLVRMHGWLNLQRHWDVLMALALLAAGYREAVLLVDNLYDLFL